MHILVIRTCLLNSTGKTNLSLVHFVSCLSSLLFLYCLIYLQHLFYFLLLAGKSLLDVFFLTVALMMIMKGVFWQNWSSSVVDSSLQKWRGWWVGLGFLVSFLVCPFNCVNCHFSWIAVFFQVTDLTLARENQASFEEYLSNNPNAHPGIDLSVNVLTTGFWPSYKSSDLNLPAELVNIDFYSL